MTLPTAVIHFFIMAFDAASVAASWVIYINNALQNKDTSKPPWPWGPVVNPKGNPSPPINPALPVGIPEVSTPVVHLWTGNNFNYETQGQFIANVLPEILAHGYWATVNYSKTPTPLDVVCQCPENMKESCCHSWRCCIVIGKQ